MSQSLTERYDDRIAGMLSCYDRLVITGTLPVVCYAAGMTGYLNAKGIRIFDYPEFAKTLRDRVRDRAASLAAEAGVTIEHIAKPHVRKEDVVARVLQHRGDHPGLVHIISAMEACDAYKPWHDKQTHKTFIRPDSGKCLHYYFYVQDAKFGLVYLRVPTWAPFRLQFYCNGHSWLARKLTAKGIGHTMADNAFVRIDDWALAQALAETLSPDQLHRTLDRYAKLYCPVSDVFGQSYHWSLMQVEYATDLAFRSAATLGPLYEQLVRQSVLNVKAEQVATFLGRQITPLLAQEIGSQFSTRIEGTCIKHRFGKCSIKMYDKHGIVLRIETTTNDVSFFKHHRKVEHRTGPATRELAPVKKSIYSLIDLREILLGCNRRYIAHLSALDDFSAGIRALGRLSKPREVDGKTVQGINFFAPVDSALLHALQNPRVNIAGIRRSNLLPDLGMISPTRLSRQLRRLLDLGVIKRVTGTAQPVSIVAAENFYGDVAQQVAGANATVSSIMSNPDQDPHLFEASPSVARLLSAATIVIYNGADYDPWMAKLLSAARSANRTVIVVADLVHRKPGDNPHLWYDPPTMPIYAKALSVALSLRDPAHKADYDRRLQTFIDSLQPLQAKIADIRANSHGVPVTATEPVFGYMATALSFKMRNERFQLAVMNDTEPRVSDVAAFENDLRMHRARVLFYNSQASDTAAQRLVQIAEQSKVPVVGVTETEPPGKTYQQWMTDQLDAVAQALANHPP